MKHALNATTCGIGLFLVAVAWPGAAVILLSAVLMVQLALCALHLWPSVTALRIPMPERRRAPGPAAARVRFSVHIATHSEPPDLVKKTLSSLLDQHGAPPFEVIVLDNNTRDEALWHPVRDFCAEHPQLRFLHRTGVLGAKAGALNIALAETANPATHIVVIDADYAVSPHFLARAAQALQESGADFLQFPQAYRNDTGAAAGISLELADYFLRPARAADGADAMLLTGTLSVIDRAALIAAGGWSAATLTEDAELGVRLRRLGFGGRLINEICGRGLLPLDFRALEQQRYRWAAGNLSTLLLGLSSLPPRSAVPVLAQLTAWTNLALPAVACLSGAWLGLLIAPAAAHPRVGALALMCLALVYLGAAVPLILAALRARDPQAGIVAAACAARLALIPAAARGTMDGLLGSEGAFRRTPKVAAAQEAIPLDLLALAGLGLAMLVWPASFPGSALAAAMLILPLPLSLHTRRALRNYRTTLAA